MYWVEIDVEVSEQVAALPVEALESFGELIAFLEVAPWSGAAYNRSKPDANMRTQAFGGDGEGLVIYLVLEDQRRVSLLRVLWVG